MTPEPVQVAIRVYGSDWGLRGHGSRQIDWLIDGTLLHRENTVFVIDQSLARGYKQRLQAKYRVYDASSCLDFISFVNTHRWNKFLLRWKPTHWVSYNDFHARHIARNAMLRAAGVQTWLYVHSVHDDGAYAKPVDAIWGRMDYEHVLNWGERDATLTSGQHHIVGPIFSSQVPKTVVAVFDSTFHNEYPYKTGTETQFHEDLRLILDQHPGMVMFYKPKLHIPSPIHDRCYILPAWINPGLVIAAADLTISLAFTSTTMEALGAGRKALWYDPMGAFRTNAYQDIPFLVAHHVQELNNFVDYWLRYPTDLFTDGASWLQTYVAPRFGGMMDGLAADRIRRLLTT